MFRPLDPALRAPLSVALRERVFLLGQRRRLQRIAQYRRPAQDPATLIAAVQRKRLVVAVTAGRSGTTYLARLLATLPDTTSRHEAAPHYFYAMRQAQHDPDAARRFLLEYKLPTIAAAPTARYADISHLLCKGFFEAYLALGIVPGVVLLRRHPRAVAASWLTRRAVPGRMKHGLRLHLHPGDPGVLPFPGWGRATDYQLCFWYALEIERRQHDYAALLQRHGGTYVDVTADELHDAPRFLQLVETLGLLDADADRGPLLATHREVSGVQHKPNQGPAAAAAPHEEEAVWTAVAPAAPWLRAAVERRYATRRDAQ